MYLFKCFSEKEWRSYIRSRSLDVAWHCKTDIVFLHLGSLNTLGWTGFDREGLVFQEPWQRDHGHLVSRVGMTLWNWDWTGFDWEGLVFQEPWQRDHGHSVSRAGMTLWNWDWTGFEWEGLVFQEPWQRDHGHLVSRVGMTLWNLRSFCLL